MSNLIPVPKNKTSTYYFFRIVWTSPKDIINTINRLKTIRPELDIEVIDAYNFFNFFKTTYSK